MVCFRIDCINYLGHPVVRCDGIGDLQISNVSTVCIVTIKQ